MIPYAEATTAYLDVWVGANDIGKLPSMDKLLCTGILKWI